MPEGSIKFSVMPAGKKNEKKCFFSLNLTDFNKLLFQIDQKIEPESIGYKQLFLKSECLFCIKLYFADIAPC